MRIEGHHLIRADRSAVWDALQDPAVLVATIPGCQELRRVAEDTYAARVEAGIASLTGVYDGTVAIREQQPLDSYVLAASGQGGPGTIEATVRVALAEAEGGTEVRYDADAVIGGAIAGVGQRVVAGVAKRSAAQFFGAVDAHLTAGPPVLQPVSVAAEAAAPAVGEEEAPGVAVYRAPAPVRTAAARPRELLVAAVVGAAIALLGVAVGWRGRGPAR